MKELFKPIKGWEGVFEISNKGYVRNIKSGTKRYGSPGKKGYWRLVLSAQGKRQSVRIHKLVGEHFIANPNNLPELNHKDGNKNNNWSNNLEWSTSSDNKYHAYKNGLYENRNNTGESSPEELTVKAIIKNIKKLSKDSILTIYKEIQHGLNNNKTAF